MNDTILFLLAMIVPGALLGLAVDTARAMWKRRKARRQECRRPQAKPNGVDKHRQIHGALFSRSELERVVRLDREAFPVKSIGSRS